jgi:hypothetical protein
VAPPFRIDHRYEIYQRGKKPAAPSMVFAQREPFT